ncbi:hypothetical protein [Castellaniella sp.]|nr:hypothetical protein [Castellaniella sp.]
MEKQANPADHHKGMAHFLFPMLPPATASALWLTNKMPHTYICQTNIF